MTFKQGDMVTCNSLDAIEPVYRVVVWSNDMQFGIDYIEANEIATVTKIRKGILADSSWMQVLTPRGKIGTVHESDLQHVDRLQQKKQGA